MKTLLLLIGLVINLSTAHAGREAGGGKAILQDDGKLDLFEFFESGLEEKAYVDPNIKDIMNAGPVVRRTLLVNENTATMVIHKLNEIYVHFPRVAEKLLETLEAYDWRFINARVFNQNDIGTTPLAPENGIKEVPVAIRYDDTKVVTINNIVLKQMADVHVAGLIFHEIFYALMRCNTSEEQQEYTHWRKSAGLTSEEARIVNAFIFDPRFALKPSSVMKEKFSLIWGLRSMDYITLDEQNYTRSSEYQKKCESTKSQAEGKISQLRSQFKNYGDFIEKLNQKINKDWEPNSRFQYNGPEINEDGALPSHITSIFDAIFGGEESEDESDRRSSSEYFPFKFYTNFKVEYSCNNHIVLKGGYAKKQWDTCTQNHVYSIEKLQTMERTLSSLKTIIQSEKTNLAGRCFDEKTKARFGGFLKLKIKIMTGK